MIPQKHLHQSTKCIYCILVTVIRGDFFQQLKDLVEKKDDQGTAAIVGSVALVGTAVLGAAATIFTGGAAAPAAVGLVSSGEWWLFLSSNAYQEFQNYC